MPPYAREKLNARRSNSSVLPSILETEALWGADASSFTSLLG